MNYILKVLFSSIAALKFSGIQQNSAYRGYLGSSNCFFCSGHKSVQLSAHQPAINPSPAIHNGNMGYCTEPLKCCMLFYSMLPGYATLGLNQTYRNSNGVLPAMNLALQLHHLCSDLHSNSQACSVTITQHVGVQEQLMSCITTVITKVLSDLPSVSLWVCLLLQERSGGLGFLGNHHVSCTLTAWVGSSSCTLTEIIISQQGCYKQFHTIQG